MVNQIRTSKTNEKSELIELLRHKQSI